MRIPQNYNFTALKRGRKLKDIKNLLYILKRAEIARLTWQIQFDMKYVFIFAAEFPYKNVVNHISFYTSSLYLRVYKI